jgi:GT2 family glycosyltransferase/glycosyltransferase involved in cell wall biosynthesis
MKRQSELVRALRAQLAETEKELADQRWIHEQFLKSPSWRWTEPVRWVVKQLRRLRKGDEAAPLPPAYYHAAPRTETTVPEQGSEAKALFTNLAQVALESFLESGATLELPHSSQPVLSIILVLFNRAELTLACLRSIAENQNQDIEVVIVDNASSDQTPQLLERLRGAHIITNSANLHFLTGANQAAHTCRGENLVFLNNDAQLLPGALPAALKTLRSSPDIGAVGGKIILLDGKLQEAGSIVWRDGSCTGYGRGDAPFAPMYNFRRDVDYCSGAFLLTPRRVWEQFGGFDNAFEPAYYEETDYCLRLWEHGLRVVYEPGAAIVHYEFASAKSTAHATSLQARNQSIFASRHAVALERQETRGVEELLRARSRNTEHRILFIDDRVPHFWLGSGFPRANTMHRTLQKLGYFITLYPTAGIHETWDQAYSDFPAEIEVMMDMGRELLEPFLRVRRGYYTTIIISRPHNMNWMASYLKAHPDWFENVNVIYDAEAVFTEREIGLRQLAGNPMTEGEVATQLKSEIRLAALADSVLTVSEKDRNTFLKHGIKHAEVLGHCLEPAAADVPFEGREGILFVGAVHVDASPNGDSLVWFLSEIYPRIREKLGDIPVTIAGVNQSEKIREMAIPPVLILGHVAFIEELYDSAKLFIAPTRYAAGIPHKIHDAAAHGLPVVSTPLLAEQLKWTDRELAIAGDAETFASQCVDVYTNASRWMSLRRAALDRIRRECSTLEFQDKLQQVVEGQAEVIRNEVG